MWLWRWRALGKVCVRETPPVAVWVPLRRVFAIPLARCQARQVAVSLPWRDSSQIAPPSGFSNAML